MELYEQAEERGDDTARGLRGPGDGASRRNTGLMADLKAEAKERGLWALGHPQEIGGGGLPFMDFVYLNEIIGRSEYGQVAVGSVSMQDSIMLDLYASPEQRERFLQPLVAGDVYPSVGLTEPEVAGSDPTLMQTTARLDGDEWVINGHKWFSSNASISDFLIVMCLTNPDVEAYRRYSMIIVPTRTPGVNILRDVPTMGEPDHRTGEPGGHAEILYEDVRVPYENIIGNPGDGFALAQKRLGPGRIHHAMRWLGQSRRAFDMLCERSLSRFTHGSLLAEKQMIQDWIAESYAELQAARLLTLQAAWKMDQLHEAGRHHSDARVEIATIKFWGARALYNVIDRAIQVHGSLGYTTDLPLESMYRAARAARIYDGPDEVHKVTVARQVLKQYKAAEVPSEHVPTRRKAAQEKFAEYLDGISLNS
jgi:acyl-CoA dehydrogenase